MSSARLAICSGSIPSRASSISSTTGHRSSTIRSCRRIGALAFSYAALSLAEGIGLYLEKAWGEFLTLAITASFLPWEIFEIFHRLTWVRVGLLVVNVLVFIYLLNIVTRHRKLGRTRGSELVSLFVLLYSHPWFLRRAYSATVLKTINTISCGLRSLLPIRRFPETEWMPVSPLTP